MNLRRRRFSSNELFTAKSLLNKLYSAQLSLNFRDKRFTWVELGTHVNLSHKIQYFSLSPSNWNSTQYFVDFQEYRVKLWSVAMLAEQSKHSDDSLWTFSSLFVKRGT